MGLKAKSNRVNASQFLIDTLVRAGAHSGSVARPARPAPPRIAPEITQKVLLRICRNSLQAQEVLLRWAGPEEFRGLVRYLQYLTCDLIVFYSYPNVLHLTYV